VLLACNSFGGGEKDDSDPVKAFLARYRAQINNLGFSGVMGICTAVAFKRVTREIAGLIGFGFIGLQVLSYYGYVNVNYDKIADDAQKVLDVSQDGKIDEKDLYGAWDKFKEVMGSHLPTAGSFSSGFVLGMYFG
jgi:uncharacterized membrane protein (Fun14 family)